MAGADNLKGKGFESRSTEEVREIASKGGKNSGAARRRKKAMKTSARTLMELPVGKSLQAKMKQMGIPEDDADYQMGVLVAMLQEALQGNVSAASFLRETMGEDPRQEMQRQELKQRKAEFEYQKQKDARMEEMENQGGTLADVIQQAYEDARDEEDENADE